MYLAKKHFYNIQCEMAQGNEDEDLKSIEAVSERLLKKYEKHVETNGLQNSCSIERI